MRLPKHQQGMTIVSLAFTLLLIGIVVFTALKLLPPFMQNFYVRGALDTLQTDDAAEYSGPYAVQAAVIKRLYVNNVDQVKQEDISISREAEKYHIDIDYEVRIPYAYNISLVISFKNHAEVRAR